jgi:hypothetical protein
MNQETKFQRSQTVAFGFFLAFSAGIKGKFFDEAIK